jgi:hypothetical protein
MMGPFAFGRQPLASASLCCGHQTLTSTFLLHIQFEHCKLNKPGLANS